MLSGAMNPSSAGAGNTEGKRQVCCAPLQRLFGRWSLSPINLVELIEVVESDLEKKSAKAAESVAWSGVERRARGRMIPL